MAQRITSTTIKVGVSFQRPGTPWTSGRIRYVGTADDLTAPPPPALWPGTEIPIPALSFARIADVSPVYGLRMSASPSKEKLHRYGVTLGGAQGIEANSLPVPTAAEADATEALICLSSGAAPAIGDAWAMRDEFLSLPRTTPKLLEFLNRWKAPLGTGHLLLPFNQSTGAFLKRLKPLKSPSLGVIRDDESRPVVLFPADVWPIQSEYRTALTQTPEAWLSVKAPLGTLTHQTKFPYLVVQASNIINAIEMTITIDKLNGVRHDKCAREDCNTPFVVRPGKSFCSHYCGHLVNLRDSRAAERAAKAKKTPATPRRKSLAR